MEDKFDHEWTLHPLEGNTGQAYMGTHKQERIFLKRNSSPFLAALSMEGITPRLIWTKRTVEGDTFSAQEWLYGHTLSKEEMRSPDIILMIKHYQNSQPLADMLRRIGGSRRSPEFLMYRLKESLPKDLSTNHFVQQIIRLLEYQLPELKRVNLSICHGDLNRLNFILTETRRLYLVDWEEVCFSDPLLDATQILIKYIPSNQWNDWLVRYGLEWTNDNIQRVEWYSFYNLLRTLKDQYQRSDRLAMNHTIQKMRDLYEFQLKRI